MVGGHDLALAMARALHEAGCKVVVADSNQQHIKAARMMGLTGVYANIFSENAVDEIDTEGGDLSGGPDRQ